MITATQVYLINNLDKINGIFLLFFAVSIVALVIFGLCYTLYEEIKFKKLLMPTILSIIFWGMLFAFIPTANTAWQMVLVPKLAEYAQIGKALDDINKIIEKIKK